MSQFDHYIPTSQIIPNEIKNSLINKDTDPSIEEDLLAFIKIYSPLETEILSQVNKEIEILNTQIKAHLKNKEEEGKKKELDQMDFELAYI